MGEIPKLMFISLAAASVALAAVVGAWNLTKDALRQRDFEADA